MSTPPGIKFTDPKQNAEGRFCTLINIGHTPEFFALDMRAVVPEGEAILLGRYFLTPQHTKRLVQALSQHLAGFEREYGEINAGEMVVLKDEPNSN